MLVPRSTALLPTIGVSTLDRLFEDLLDGSRLVPGAWEPNVRMPAVNMWEDEKAYHLEAELPGIAEKDLEISILGNELRIEGGKEEEKVEEKRSYHRRERTVGKLSRILRFPVDLEDSKVEAKYENGVLRMTLPKAAAALPRRVAVKVV